MTEGSAHRPRANPLSPSGAEGPAGAPDAARVQPGRPEPAQRRPPGPASPRLTWSALEWRLFLTGLLASVWTFVLAMLWTATPATAPQAAEPEESPVARAPEAPAPRWLDQLPPGERPVVTPPAGWVVTTLPQGSLSTGRVSAKPTPVVSVVKRRPLRIRTRSS